MEIKHKTFSALTTLGAKQLLNSFIKNTPILKENIINIGYRVNHNQPQPYLYDLFYWGEVFS